MKKPAPRPKTPVKISLPIDPRLLLKKWGIPFSTAVIVLIFIVTGMLVKNGEPPASPTQEAEVPVITNPDIIPLPSPTLRSTNSVEAAIKINQPRRSFKPDQLSQKQIGQLLWSAQGVTADWGGRSVTSSKSTFPLTVYLLVNNIEKLEKGVYQYIPGERLPAHQLLPHKLGEFGETLFDIVNQTPLREPPAVFIITGNLKKMAEAYGGVAHDREVYLEVGHAAQNMYLQAESLKLGMIALPNFDEAQVRQLLSIPLQETLVYIIPVGYIRE